MTHLRPAFVGDADDKNRTAWLACENSRELLHGRTYVWPARGNIAFCRCDQEQKKKKGRIKQHGYSCMSDVFT